MGNLNKTQDTHGASSLVYLQIYVDTFNCVDAVERFNFPPRDHLLYSFVVDIHEIYIPCLNKISCIFQNLKVMNLKVYWVYISFNASCLVDSQVRSKMMHADGRRNGETLLLFNIFEIICLLNKTCLL